MASVFLSYRHESDPHPARVRDFGERLRREGKTHNLSIALDQFADAEQFHYGGPPEGWPQWSKDRAKHSDKVLIVASAGWFRAYERKEVPGTGLGCAAEAGVLEQRLYNAGGINHDIRVVVIAAGDEAGIPLDLQRYKRFDATRDFRELLAWLTGQPALAGAAVAPAAPADFPAAPPPIAWPFCDCDPVRDAFARLLTAGAARRVLFVQGESGTGKSDITRHLLGTALGFDWLATGRLDFKSGSDLDGEFARFTPQLGVDAAILATAGQPVPARLDAVLTELHRQPRPTLLLFDTYEQAGDYVRWVEDRALVAAMRAPWLRIIVAGQHTPGIIGQPWAAVTEPLQKIEPPGWRDWHRYGCHHKPHIATEDFVERLHVSVNGNPTLLSKVLGPVS